MLKAVIFDLDGLLVDSTPLQWEANKIFLQKHGKQFAVPQNREGMRIIDILLEMKDLYDLAGDIEDLYMDRQQIYFDIVRKELELFPGALELLENLKKRGIKIALATSGDRNYISVLFEKFPQLNDYFSVIVSSEDVKIGKPNPEVFLTTAKKLNAAAQECVVLEDSVNGILAAKAAHMEVICIPNLNYPEADYFQADAVFANLHEAAQAIPV